jgi:hypothetical protein
MTDRSAAPAPVAPPQSAPAAAGALSWRDIRFAAELDGLNPVLLGLLDTIIGQQRLLAHAIDEVSQRLDMVQTQADRLDGAQTELESGHADLERVVDSLRERVERHGRLVAYANLGWGW